MVLFGQVGSAELVLLFVCSNAEDSGKLDFPVFADLLEVILLGNLGLDALDELLLDLFLEAEAVR